MNSEINRATSALFCIDAGCCRVDWVKVGMSAKAGGLSFDDFHTWSATAGNYSGNRDFHNVWKSFNASGGVTASTLLQWPMKAAGKIPIHTLKVHVLH